ncbi:DUF5606 domain-containing protein [Saccharicrinis sp. FJH54]|uniref:DUF5606 family protein n=1 Tax=Saccharicrinis sp. FJH54 TaxID=3344665 RepID=UPI0035D41089
MLKGILSISGKPGLYKMVTQGKNSIIVESLLDGKRIPAHSFAKVISLEDIAIFTETEEVPLADVFKAIIEKEGEGNPAPDAKSISGDDLKTYFEEILPEYDRDRVYVSDMKKVLAWYNLLLENDLLKTDVEEDSNDGEEGIADTEEKE